MKFLIWRSGARRLFQLRMSFPSMEGGFFRSGERGSLK